METRTRNREDTRVPQRLLAPSILSADFGRLAEEVRAVEEAGADWIHVDVMDGHFVPNITIGPDVVKAVRRATTLPVDVHLMITDPDRYLEAFVTAGADWLGVHVEACVHLHRTVQRIRELGAKASVAVNPATPLCLVEPILEHVDMVLLMTVNPGFGGQKFIGSAVSKIRQLRRWIDDRSLDVLIQVDGGVCVDTVDVLVESGVDVFVAGSAVFQGSDYHRTVRALKDRFNPSGKSHQGGRD
ncbi:ribulose-phosphate 3-epimerase [Desulfosoma caldarium]|uniref:Ribulose-phosphate 3-epimerase n=1 Tax=Desulfosoma caldarium TaxID=610254 RepID=A0A3N1UPQ1_9BACT|nr:ribulose-phosphate 3-epimerase [Desulfosoma caldarium]ROQ90720.1 ribulose-5-phosphate 3-epimerase [Desulfosoma caldarium]